MIHVERVHRRFSLRRAFTDNGWTFLKLRTLVVSHTHTYSIQPNKILIVNKGKKLEKYTRTHAKAIKAKVGISSGNINYNFRDVQASYVVWLWRAQRQCHNLNKFRIKRDRGMDEETKRAIKCVDV